MKQPEIIIIAALAESNRAIAQNGHLPWKIPDDSQRFQKLTLGHTVVMGRKTWENDLESRPLPGRNNIVISSALQEIENAGQSLDYPFELISAESLAAALEKSQEQEKIFIAGGASIYEQALDLADTLELTLVEGDFAGDTFFPDYKPLVDSQFKLVCKEFFQAFDLRLIEEPPTDYNNFGLNIFDKGFLHI